jgi:hypothetical protein
LTDIIISLASEQINNGKSYFFLSAWQHEKYQKARCGAGYAYNRIIQNNSWWIGSKNCASNRTTVHRQLKITLLLIKGYYNKYSISMKSLYSFFVANYFGHRVINYLSVCCKFIYCCLMSREQLFSFIRDENKFPNE